MDKTLPYPLNTNATTDEDRFNANAEQTDIAAITARVAALEKNALLIASLPVANGAYSLKITITNGKAVCGWTQAADGNLPAVPAVEGTYNLSVVDDEGDTVVSWEAATSGSAEE